MALITGELLEATGNTTDGSTPVLLGTYLPDGYASVTAATVFISGIDTTNGNATLAAIINIVANATTAGYSYVRTDLVPIRSGSTPSLQNCQVTFQVNAEGINVYVTGKIATDITWTVFMHGSSQGTEE